MASVNTLPKEQTHYKKVTETYHEAFFYKEGSEYETWQINLITNVFQPLRNVGTQSRSPYMNGATRIADIGGGTGRIAEVLEEKLELGRHSVLCVDNSEDMLEQAKARNVDIALADACSFAKETADQSWDGVLMKEVVHHIPETQIPGLYRDLFRGLKPGGICLTVTRPHEDIDYPFFEKAKQVWMDGQPSSDLYVSAMKDAGFADVSATSHDFPVTMSLKQWTKMVKNRMWSTFADEHFSEEELDEGIKEIENRFGSKVKHGSGSNPSGTDVTVDPDTRITFNERMVFVSGFKP